LKKLITLLLLITSPLLAVQYDTLTSASGATFRKPKPALTETSAYNLLKSNNWLAIKNEGNVNGMAIPDSLLIYGQAISNANRQVSQSTLTQINETFKGRYFSSYYSSLKGIHIAGVNVKYVYFYYTRFDLDLDLPTIEVNSKLEYLYIQGHSSSASLGAYAFGANSTNNITVPPSWKELRMLTRLLMQYQKLTAAQQTDLVTQLEALQAQGFMADNASSARYLYFNAGAANKNLPVDKTIYTGNGWTDSGSYVKKTVGGKEWRLYMNWI